LKIIQVSLLYKEGYIGKKSLFIHEMSLDKVNEFPEQIPNTNILISCVEVYHGYFKMRKYTDYC